MSKLVMAHQKKDNKLDKLIDIVWSLADEMKSMKSEIDSLKWKKKDEPIIIEPLEEVKRETPYKVIPIQSIIRDEWYTDPSMQWLKKIYMWLGKTFKNKEEASLYLDRMKRSNPWQQYDIFPV